MAFYCSQSPQQGSATGGAQEEGEPGGTLDFVGVERVLFALAVILELVAQQRFLRAHGGEVDLVVVVVAVLP